MSITTRLCLLLGLVSACDHEPEVIVNERVLELDQTGAITGRRGLACMTLSLVEGRSGAGGGAADFSVSVRGTPAGVLVETSTDLQPAETRVFSEATLKSRALQSFRLQTRAGKTYEFRYWGGRCDPFDVNEPQN